IEEEVYVTQPKGFKDPHNPKHVYKVVKALYGFHQAPKAWYIILVQVYVDDVIFGSTNKAWCDEFEVLMKGEFEMSVMASRSDIMFVVSGCSRHQVTPTTSYLNAVKKIFKYLKGQPNLVDIADDALIKFNSASDSDDDPLPYAPNAGWEMVPSTLGSIHAYYDMEGHTKHFNSLRELLHMVERNDLRRLLGAVDNLYQREEPDTFALLLWGDLHVLFQSLNDEDACDFWRNQDGWRIRSWCLYPHAQVHVLETVDGWVIYMFVDVSYPLSAATFQRMLKHGFEVPKLLVGGDLTMAEQLMLLLHDPAVFDVPAGFFIFCWFLVAVVWLFAAVLVCSCCWNKGAILKLTSLKIYQGPDPNTPHTRDVKGPPDLINTKRTQEQEVHNELINIQPTKESLRNNTKISVRMLTRSMVAKLTVASASECLFAEFLFEIEPKKEYEALKHPGWVNAMQEELNQFYRNKVWILVPFLYEKIANGFKWVFRNKKDEHGTVVRNKAKLVA
nr:retrovirus-related Pol polyprotein from transposon TNT 1-94 [Tanacetum cinerariifolium]